MFGLDCLYVIVCRCRLSVIECIYCGMASLHTYQALLPISLQGRSCFESCPYSYTHILKGSKVLTVLSNQHIIKETLSKPSHYSPNIRNNFFLTELQNILIIFLQCMSHHMNEI